MANDPLGSFRIAAPCTASWEGMAGDARVRHCALCSLNVYNVAEMTRDEVRELLVRTEGRVCARLYRRADGTVITRDCPTGLRAMRQRASRVAAALVTALLSLPALAFGGTACNEPRLKTRGSNVTLNVEKVATAQGAAFTGVVLYQRVRLPGVTVIVRDETTERERVVITDAKGAFTIVALNDGIYRVEVILPGFTTARMEHLELKADEVTHASITLRMDSVAMGALTPMIDDTKIGTTTVSGDMLNKLPF